MLKWIYIKTDFRQLIREPMMAALFFSPVLIPVIFYLLFTELVPFIQQYASFSLLGYESYILSGVLIMPPAMLGIVMGFMMLDDRDGHITELFQVTPLSLNGYLLLRLGLVFFASFIFVIYSYYVMGLMLVSLPALIYLALLLSAFSACMGLLLFSLAEDKVKGLTYAKGLNLLIIFAFTDLFHLNWLKILGIFFPTYWITRIIQSPGQPTVLIAGLFVHALWLFFLILWFSRQSKKL